MKFATASLLMWVSTWLVFGEEEKKPIVVSGPAVWTTSIEAFAVNDGEPPVVKSIITADKEIRVTRIEVFDEQGRV